MNKNLCFSIYLTSLGYAELPYLKSDLKEKHLKILEEINNKEDHSYFHRAYDILLFVTTETLSEYLKEIKPTYRKSSKKFILMNEFFKLYPFPPLTELEKLQVRKPSKTDKFIKLSRLQPKDIVTYSGGKRGTIVDNRPMKKYILIEEENKRISYSQILI